MTHEMELGEHATPNAGTETFSVLGIPVAKVTLADAIARVNHWVDFGTRTYTVTFAAVHMVVEAQRDRLLNQILQRMDMVCPDGRPISWIGRYRHGDQVSQVAGPDFMPAFIEQSVTRGYKHFIYGGGPGVAESAARNLELIYPGVKIAGYYSPPFRTLTEDEKSEVCHVINESGAQLVWVCLGCPKQEKWVLEFHDKLDAKVLLAVGYAIDLVAGMRVRAPNVVRQSGLEWLFRLIEDPGRLWKRYLTTNFLFIVWNVRDLIFGTRQGVANKG